MVLSTKRIPPLDPRRSPRHSTDNNGANPGGSAEKFGWNPENNIIKAMAKFIAWDWALRRAGSDNALTRTTAWAKEFKIHKHNLIEEIRRRLPEFDNEWDGQLKAVGREPLSEEEKQSQLMNRLKHMFFERILAPGQKKGERPKAIRACISKEHPEKSNCLLPYKATAQDMIDHNQPIYKTEILRNWGELLEIKAGFKCKREKQ